MRRRPDPVYKPVNDHQRIGIPSGFREGALEPQTKPVTVSLWMVKSGRYRLLIGEHAEHPDIQALRTRISEREGAAAATEFDDDGSTVIGVRLVDAELSPGKEWRLSLPDIIMDALRIRKERQAVVVLDGKFIEIWGVETFEAALKVPTSDLLR